MRKKFTMLLMSLLAFVGVAKAGVTDFPTMSEGENITWYTISNTRSTSGKYLYWTESGVKDSNTRTGASFFYVTGSADACYIHNYATDLLFSGKDAWTKDGVACKLTVSPLETGLMIGFNGTYLNEQNFENGFTTWGDINDDGSVFVFEEVTDFSAIIDVPAAKTDAIAELNNLATVSVIYSAAVTSAVNEINAVTPASNGLKDLNDAVEAINAVVANYRNAAYQALAGKYFTIETLTEARANGFMQMSTSSVVGTEKATSPANIWQFVYNNGAVNVFNPYTGKYLCEPGNNSTNIAVTTEQASAGAYQLNINAAAEVDDAKVKLTSNGKSVHMAGGHTLVRWDNGGASEWQVVEVKDFSSIIASYKTASIESMDEWKNLSVVFDAALINAAEAAINGIATTGWATFAAIDAELTKVTDAVAAKMFTFQTIATDSHRENVWVSANMSTRKAIGLHGESNYNSIWSLRHAGGVSFYLYNELNSVYMGKPSENCPLTENPAAAYTFEVIDAAENIVEMKSNGETLHASNHADDKLLNWDGDENASRWMVKIIDVAKDIQDLLDTIEESDYAEVPELGQYPTAAYDALVAARTSAKTVEEVEAAIAAFKASLNRPVYIITSAWDGGYSAGSAIYYDGAWKWKKANRYDRQMWMTIPGYTEEGVPAAVDAYDANNTSYGFCDYLTGTKIRGKEGVQLVKITGWPEAYSLQYAASGGDAAHHAQSGGALVNWHPALINDRQASAWTVEYLGNTYELKDLTNEQLAALTEAQAAFDSKIYLFDAKFGDGVGRYQGEEATIKGTLFEVADFLSLNLNVLKEKTVDEINAWTASLNNMPAATINLPAEGYYRIHGANYNVKPAGHYITNHTNEDGGRIAMTEDNNATTIYYYKDGKLQAYQNGKYIGLSFSHWTFADDAASASDIVFAASSYVAGAYTIKSADCYLRYKINGDVAEIDRCQAEESANDSWLLEKLEKETITYTYKAGETVLATQEVKEFAGMPYPAANAVLPLGYTATALEGNVAKDETEKVVACVLNAEAIPFEYYDSYAKVEQWYYLNFAKDQHFLFYAEDNTVLDVNKTAIDRTNREAYAWAFIGTPATGFQVVNKLAGADKGLKAMKSDALTGGVVGEGAHTFKLTASEHFTKGFYMAATNGESADRFNSQGGKMVYWVGADAGSTFTVTVCPFGAVAELEALIAEAEELKTTVDANTGGKIGEYAAATGVTLVAAIETAKTKGDAATADDVAALQTVIDATKVILPTAGSYYQFHSAVVAFAETKAVYSYESSALWKTLNENDKSFYWMAVENAGGIALKNAKSGKYLNGNEAKSGAWSVSDTPANIDVKILTKEGANGYQYGVILNGWQMHANGHGNGNGTSGDIVSWNAEAYSASAWYITEVELPEFCEIVYNFKYQGETKYTQTDLLAPGAEFPEIAISLPYGVSTNAAKPDGTVTEDKAFDFDLNIEKELPFEAVATGTPTKWYYTQMHANPEYGFYVSAHENNLVWHGAVEDAAKYVANDANHDDYLWGFVGNLWDGFKMVNKKSGKAVCSTGSGNVTVVDNMANATAFMAWNSSTKSAGDWFCLKYPTKNQYLNLNYQNRVIEHWDYNDNGSSFFVTEVGKEYALTIAGESGYATYYSDYRLAIPENENVVAYIVEGIEEGYADFVPVTGVIPAHTGIILKGVEGQDVVVTFVTSAAATADVSKNHLKGTTTRQLITPGANETCYVLANPKDENEQPKGVGLYKATLKYNNETAFYNNANKIYLPVPIADAQAPRALMFRFGGTTEIETVETTDNGQQTTVIYDLSGRRIEKIVEKGIYIVNGKKVIF